MRGILILVHGSKREETEKTVKSIVEKVKKKTGEEKVVGAYLQFSEINLKKGVEMLIYMGANQIVIMPLFIFDGVHVTQDIPNELAQIQKEYPQITFKTAKHIGDDDRIADIVIDRISKL
jgi:sirohydrochlorin ferrochelatase